MKRITGIICIVLGATILTATGVFYILGHMEHVSLLLRIVIIGPLGIWYGIRLIRQWNGEQTVKQLNQELAETGYQLKEIK